MSNTEDPNFQQPQAETMPSPAAPEFAAPTAPAAPEFAAPAAPTAPAEFTAPAAPAAPAQAAPVYQPYQAAPQQVQQSTLPTTLAQTNTYALVSIITVLLSPILGIVFGHLGLSQIKRNGDAGRGIALTAVILGYVSLAAVILFFITYLSIIGFMIASMGSMMDGYYY